MSKFNLRLNELRQQTGLTQQELADDLGISKSSVNMYERREREPGLDLLETITNVFGVSVDYLVGKSTVGNYIRELRTQKGLTQEQLGEMVGVQKAAVQKWENGSTQNLKRATVNRLSEIFNVSPLVFVSDDTIGAGVEDSMNPNEVDNLKVRIDYEGLDEVLEKVSRLNRLLKETIELINSLKM